MYISQNTATVLLLCITKVASAGGERQGADSDGMPVCCGLGPYVSLVLLGPVCHG